MSLFFNPSPPLCLQICTRNTDHRSHLISKMDILQSILLVAGTVVFVAGLFTAIKALRFKNDARG
jgi:hypothetical protein